MANAAKNIKKAIRTNLDALVTSGVLGSVIEKDINIDILDQDLAGFPVALLGPSSMAADFEYPQSNRRVYRYDVMFIQMLENLSTNWDVEDMRDAIALQFDNDPTLNGAAVLCISAAFSEHAQVRSASGKSYLCFYVTIKATTLVDLSYNF